MPDKAGKKELLYTSMEEKTLTREDFKQEQENKEQAKPKIRIRLLPLWFRVLLVTFLIVVSVVSGTIVGYSIMGGGEMVDVFSKSTWTHIFDLVYSEK
ncbi:MULTISPECIES: DNA-directed RNA polymerase subunit beta [Bacillaceae]|uniref:DNA-directed RNA polymerase subunit beta n=1 Tax=Peribacillus huizhouensis TaxID=1501239 RepID=A0ABR6CS47_9BACI|nr:MULTISPECIES: DNA-directed RNA polymerase subunit beta [Bacillaceae]MBA9027854.1 hypothetical protein [Peribacillus huizhouensis]